MPRISAPSRMPTSSHPAGSSGHGWPKQSLYRCRRCNLARSGRRIYDLRDTYATFSLAAGVSLFSLARRMGTSVAMIDRTYGHLAPDAEEYERGLLDDYDRRCEATPRSQTST